MILLMSLLFTYTKANSQIKIGYVNKSTILKQMPEYKTVEDDYKKYTNKYLDTLSSIETAMYRKADSLKKETERITEMYKGGQIKTEEELKKHQDDLDSLKSEILQVQDFYEKYRRNVNTELQKKQDELLKPLQEKMIKTVETVAKEMKINFIFDMSTNSYEGVLLYGEKEFDITFKVLDKLK
jgi:outer membrane protein